MKTLIPQLCWGEQSEQQHYSYDKKAEFFSFIQTDFRSVEELKNAGKPHKYCIFARYRRSFYSLFLWCFFAEWCPNPTRGYKGLSCTLWVDRSAVYLPIDVTHATVESPYPFEALLIKAVELFQVPFRCGVPGMLIMVCMAIYAVLVQGIAAGGDLMGAIWICVDTRCCFASSSSRPGAYQNPYGVLTKMLL